MLTVQTERATGRGLRRLASWLAYLLSGLGNREASSASYVSDSVYGENVTKLEDVLTEVKDSVHILFWCGNVSELQAWLSELVAIGPRFLHQFKREAEHNPQC